MSQTDDYLKQIFAERNLAPQGTTADYLDQKFATMSPAAQEEQIGIVRSIAREALGVVGYLNPAGILAQLAPSAAGGYALMATAEPVYKNQNGEEVKHPFDPFIRKPGDKITLDSIKNLEKGLERQKRVQEFMENRVPIYSALLQESRKSVIGKAFGYVFEKYDKATKALGDETYEKTGDEGLATTVTTALNAAAFAFGGKLAKKAGGIVRNTRTAIKLGKTNKIKESIIELEDLVAQDPQTAQRWSEFYTRYGIEKPPLTDIKTFNPWLKWNDSVIDLGSPLTKTTTIERPGPKAPTFAEAPDTVPKAAHVNMEKATPKFKETMYGREGEPISYAEPTDTVPRARLTSSDLFKTQDMPAKKGAKIVEQELTEPGLIFRRETGGVKAKRPVSAERLMEEVNARRTPTVTLDSMGLQQMFEWLSDFRERYKAAKAMDGAIKRGLGSRWDVESPFLTHNAPETGFRVKNFHSTESSMQDYALHRIMHNTKLFNGKEELAAEVVLGASSKEYFNSLPKSVQNQIRPAVADLLQNMGMGKEILAKEGMKVDFKARVLADLMKSMQSAKGQKLVALQSAYRAAEQMNFVHIPTGMWFQQAFLTRPEAISKMRSLVARKRKNLTINDLITEGVITKADLHPGDIIGNYWRRVGRDIATLRFKNAALTEGLVRTKHKKGYLKVDSFRHPMFKGLWAKDVVIDVMDTVFTTNPRDFMASKVRKAFALTKMAQFTQPWYLWFYDARQSLAAVGPWAFTTQVVPKYWKGAWKEYFSRGKEYYEAYENGLFSEPYANPMDSYLKMIERAKVMASTFEKTGGKVGTVARAAEKQARVFKKQVWEPGVKDGLLRALYRLPRDTVGQMYTGLWDAAWGGDRLLRLATYKYLKDKGFSPREAGQLGARFHGDYASVPAKTRETLNLPFFTPTFKIAMAKVYTDMVKASINVATMQTGGKMVTRGGKQVVQSALLNKRGWRSDPAVQRRMVLSLANIIGTMVGIDQLMQACGYKREGFGYKYSKKVVNEEGKERELVVSYSEPFNLANKYAYRVNQAFDDPTKPFTASLAGLMKYEVHPLLKASYSVLMKGEDEMGNRIYNELDDDAIKFTKGFNYLVETLFTIYGDAANLMGAGEPTKRDIESQAMARQEFGAVGSFVLARFTHAYTRGTANRRIAWKMKQLEKVYRDTIYDAVQNDRPISEAWKRNFKEYVQELRMEVDK